MVNYTNPLFILFGILFYFYSINNKYNLNYILYDLRNNYQYYKTNLIKPLSYCLMQCITLANRREKKINLKEKH